MGYTKCKGYITQTVSTEELKRRISAVINRMNEETLKKLGENKKFPLSYILRQSGGRIKILLH